MCIAGLASWKIIAFYGLYRGKYNEEKNIFKCQQLHTDSRYAQVRSVSVTTTAIGITAWLGLQQSTVILHGLSVFFTGNIGQLKGNVVGIMNDSASFQSLDDGTNFYILPGNIVYSSLLYPSKNSLIMASIWPFQEKLLLQYISMNKCRVSFNSGVKLN